MSVAVVQKQPVSPANGLAAQANAGRRFFDNSHSAWMVKVFPGEFYVTRQPDEILVTVLGSCVSACIRDPVVGVGGMNHFMLAKGGSGGWGDDPRSARFWQRPVSPGSSGTSTPRCSSSTGGRWSTSSSRRRVGGLDRVLISSP